MSEVKIFLADDHAILREGLSYIIAQKENYCIIGESGDGREALGNILKLKPDVVILDISMPSMTGIEVARRIKKEKLLSKIIILSQHHSDQYVQQLLKIGVNAYVLKEKASDELLKAIDEVLNDNLYLSPEITTRVIYEHGLLHGIKQKKSKELLSPREAEILKLLSEGSTNNKIAEIINISEQTVKTHRSNIMKKLNARSIAELVRYAIKEGIVEI